MLAHLPQPVLPRAVCEGYNPGKILVDDPRQPGAALIWLSCGYLYLFGDAARVSQAELRDALGEDLVPAWRAAGETGYILAPCTPGWASLLDRVLDGQPHDAIFRRAFILQPEVFAELRDHFQVPEGFELRRVDAALADRLGAARTWPSTQDYLARGLGFVILKDDEIAAACTSVFGCSTGLEIDVFTAEPFRRAGLATAVAAVFIQECLNGGRQPNWECFWDNELSTALALKLGYALKQDYPVVYWEPGV